MPQRNEAPASADELIARARALVGTLAECAPEGARERRVAEAAVRALRDAGAFRALQPRRWGGAEVDLRQFGEMIMTIAEGDMSTAWIFGLLGVAPWVVALMDPRAAEDVWGDDSSVLIGLTIAPFGTVTPVDGGYRLSGRWRYGSGSLNADWMLLGARAPVDVPRPDRLVFVVPRSDYELIDVWHTSGLRGTGSNDVVVKDAFVPLHRVRNLRENATCTGAGQAVHDGPLYRLPFGQVFGVTVAYPAIGALRSMLDAYIAYAQGRVRNRNRVMLEDPEARLVVAEIDHAIDEMTLLARRNAEELTAIAERGEAAPMVLRLRQKFQLSSVTERCRVLAARLFQVCGTAGLLEDYPFGRIQNDIIAARQHITNQLEFHGREWGTYLLTGDVPDDPML